MENPGRKVVIIDSGNDFLQFAKLPGVKLVPLYKELDKQTEFETRILPWILLEVRDSTIIIDEVQNFCTPSVISDGFKSLIVEGAHSGNNVIAITQDIAMTNRIIDRNSDYILCSTGVENGQIKRIQEMTSKEAYQILERSPRYSFILRDSEDKVKIRIIQPLDPDIVSSLEGGLHG